MDTALVSYLEMTAAPDRERAEPPHKGLMVVREWEMDVDQYLHLQKTIGERFHWVERLNMSREHLRALIHHPAVEIYVLYSESECAGFAEIDLRQFPNVELKFFGLMPDFIGKGLGAYLLSEVVDLAWQHKPHRIWLHTDSNDHPRALDNYTKAGFHIYKQQVEAVTLCAPATKPANVTNPAAST